MSFDISLNPRGVGGGGAAKCAVRHLRTLGALEKFEKDHCLPGRGGEAMVTLLVHSESCGPCRRYLPLFEAGANSEDLRYALEYNVLKGADATASPLANGLRELVSHFPCVFHVGPDGVPEVGERVYEPRPRP